MKLSGIEILENITKEKNIKVEKRLVKQKYMKQKQKVEKWWLERNLKISMKFGWKKWEIIKKFKEKIKIKR